MRKLLTLTLLFCLWACQSESGKSPFPKKVELLTPTGESIESRLAITGEEQEQGLSGVKPDDFGNAEGMLFIYLEDSDKHFWMPDTYFDLDIIFVDKDLKILDIIRKLPFYVGRANPDLIPRARSVWARHALEMKASSPLSAKLKVGDQLKWKADMTLPELEEKLRRPQN